MGRNRTRPIGNPKLPRIKSNRSGLGPLRQSLKLVPEDFYVSSEVLFDHPLRLRRVIVAIGQSIVSASAVW